MSKFKEVIIIVIGTIIGIILGLIINTLMFWAIGNLIVYTFGINYNWSLIQGFVIGLLYAMLKIDLKNLVKKED